jgi:putative sterol carrier protein
MVLIMFAGDDPMASSAQQYFDKMPAAFRPEMAAGLNATYQFELSGEGGGIWYVKVSSGELQVGQGEQPNPDVIVRAAAADYVAIAEGRMNAMLAMVTGKFKISGNMGMAMKLEKLFKR